MCEPAALSVEMHGLELTSPAPALLIGPAIGTTAQMWHPVLPYLTDLRVILYSHRGHGGSQAPSGPYALTDLVGDLLAVMDQLGIDTAHHVGAGLGGLVAMQLALTGPERVSSLTTVASSAHPGDRDSWLERAAAARAHGLAPMSAASMQRWFTADFQEDPAAREVQLAFLGVDPQGYAGCCEALADVDLRSGLGAITVPTLVLAGDSDEELPLPHSEAIAAGIPGARLEVVEHSAHLPPTQQPRAVAELLRAFLGLPRLG